MSHVPSEYWMLTSILLSGATYFVALFVVPDLALTVGVISFIVYSVAYAYSPLPQGPTAPNHMDRKRKWGFKVEHKRDQKTLEDFNDQ